MNRYYGRLMYSTFLPFSIYAPDEKEALTELQKKAPALLNDAEKKEVLFSLTRIPKADRVQVIRKESPNAKRTADKKSALTLT